MGNEALKGSEAELTQLRDRLEQLEKRVQGQRKLLAVLHSLSGEMSLDILLGRIMDQVTQVIDADRSSLFLYDRPNNELYSKIAQGLDTTEIRFPADRGLAGHVARTGEVLNIEDAYQDSRFNPEVDHRTGYRTRSVLAMPMISRSGETIGVLQVLNKHGEGPADHGTFDAEDEEILGALATNAAVFVENAQLYEQIEELFAAFARTSITAIDERDPCTSGHSLRVTEYTLKLARLVHADDGPRFGAIHYTRDQLRELRYASLLHDYGKIGVRENVLCKANKLSDAGLLLVLERFDRLAVERRLRAAERKLADEPVDEAGLAAELETLERRRALVEKVNRPEWLGDDDLAELVAMREGDLLTSDEHEALSVRKGNLTAAEWDDMRSHVAKSFLILREIPWPKNLRSVPEIAHTHHEKIDGSGYPRGLKDPEIPFGGKMMCVADIYDALTASDRPYKKAMTHEKACEILGFEVADGHLDADLVRLFIEGRAWDIATRKRTALLEAVA